MDPLSPVDSIPALETKKLQIDSCSTPPLAKFLQYGKSQVITTPDVSTRRYGVATNSLQLGTCEGNAELRQWAYNFTAKIHRPAYADFEILLHPGNTNAWSKLVGLLVEKGDYILTENFTYPSSQAHWIPHGNFAAPVALDGQGLRADALEEVLGSWDKTHPGVRKPHVLYMVSVGSNPTGLTMGAERRQAIYDTCVKHGESQLICRVVPWHAINLSMIRRYHRRG